MVARQTVGLLMVVLLMVVLSMVVPSTADLGLTVELMVELTVELMDGLALMVESMVGLVKTADLRKADSWMEIARPKDGLPHYHG